MLKNKIIKLLVGTNNNGKLKEIRDLLPKRLEIYSPQDFKIKSPPENGKTFKENSLISVLLIGLMFIHVAISFIPGFPGITNNVSQWFDLLSASDKACSLPPDPITSIFIYAS